MLHTEGKIFNIQRYALFDGPGIRTVVFLQGCPLRCVWCHNPEGVPIAGSVMFNASRCIACLDCVSICHRGAHRFQDGLHLFDRTRCIACHACTTACYSGALSFPEKYVTVEEVMKTVLKDLPYYKESGGGLTLSGGEPLLQWEFSLELLRAAKEAGIHTAVETCGFGSIEAITALLEYTDLFLFDIKATGDDEHLPLTGVSSAPILRNLALLNRLGADVILRCPIVPGANDTSAHMDGIAEISRTHSSVREIHLEPYHRLGISKLDQLGIAPSFDTEPPTNEYMEELRQYIAAHSGKPVCIS